MRRNPLHEFRLHETGEQNGGEDTEDDLISNMIGKLYVRNRK